MCFYEQVMFECGDWKWDRFRQHCNREYRIGETCGIKLVFGVTPNREKCKICQKIDTKCRRKADQQSKIERWQREGGKFKASIEKAREIVADLDKEINQLLAEKGKKQQNFGKGR